MFWAQKILTTVKNEQHRLFFFIKRQTFADVETRCDKKVVDLSEKWRDTAHSYSNDLSTISHL